VPASHTNTALVVAKGHVDVEEVIDVKEVLDQKGKVVRCNHANQCGNCPDNTWVPVVLSPGANIIPSLFIFCLKRNETGKIIRYKARLVVKQKFSIDYFDTFTPTICASTLSILLSFAAQNGMAVYQCVVLQSPV
jgi:Reverse transcriptase (RNA-dependent DNA polymerase)